MKEIPMRDFDYIASPAKLLTPEVVQMVSSIHEHKGKQELFLESNVDELKTLLEVALIQSTGASNRIEGIFTSDKRLEELVSQKAEPRNRSEQEIGGNRHLVYPDYAELAGCRRLDRVCHYFRYLWPKYRTEIFKHIASLFKTSIHHYSLFYYHLYYIDRNGVAPAV